MMIYVGHYCCHPSFAILTNKILTNPLDEVVFKCAINDLMK